MLEGAFRSWLGRRRWPLLLLVAGGGGLWLTGACSPGELLLSSRTSESDGVGGVPDEVAGSQGGESASGGGTAVAPKPSEPTFDTPPCSWSGPCTPLCHEAPKACLPCEDTSQCGGAYPHCDIAQGSCVECLTGADCTTQFGASFTACSAGRCVECQRDGDCPGSLECWNGWCGECREDYHCPFNQVCRAMECVD